MYENDIDFRIGMGIDFRDFEAFDVNLIRRAV
jgi:hypothetical protein